MNHALDPRIEPDNDIFELAKVDSRNSAHVIRSLTGHIKAVSLIWIKLLGLPLLDGVIVRRWSRNASTIVDRFCRQHQFSQVLLRIDKKDQRWTQRRGGFLVSFGDLPRIVAHLATEDFVSILLEPASPWADLYSFGAIVDPDQGKLTIEIVGPGFDASDILRSDIQPHERFELPWPPVLRHDPQLPEEADFNRVYLTDPGSYVKSVTQRLIKISKRLRDPHSFDKGSELSDVEIRRERAAAIALLEERKQTLLLRNLHSYAPVPSPYLRTFVSGILKLMLGLEGRGIALGATSISGSFISEDRLVYWDFFPANPEQFTVLYRGI